MNNDIEIIISMICSIIFLIFILVKIDRYKSKKIIKLNSKRYKYKMKIVDNYNYKTGRKSNRYKYHYRCNSLSEFRKKDLSNLLFKHVQINRSLFERVSNEYKYIEECVNEYLDACNKLPSYMSDSDIEKLNIHLKKHKVNNIEAVLVSTYNANLDISTFKLEGKKTYVSPKGRNHYSDTKIINISDVREILSKSYKEDTEKDEIKAERKLLTPSLRYNILKRDKFTCQICGRNQADGVKLHVDHIKPVSKGGKTVESNLRTLCDECNLGKSAKYDPNSEYN